MSKHKYFAWYIKQKVPEEKKGDLLVRTDSTYSASREVDSGP